LNAFKPPKEIQMPAEQEELERLRLAAVNRAEEAERQAARAESAESRVQELEGERDELNDACRELQEHNMMEACDECNDREEAAITRAEAAESHLARLEETVRQVAYNNATPRGTREWLRLALGLESDSGQSAGAELSLPSSAAPPAVALRPDAQLKAAMAALGADQGRINGLKARVARLEEALNETKIRSRYASTALRDASYRITDSEQRGKVEQAIDRLVEIDRLACAALTHSTPPSDG
jgi:chromosome segregation ATPase